MGSRDRERTFILVTFGGEDHILESRAQTICGEKVFSTKAHSSQKSRKISRIDREEVCPDCFKEARIDA